MTQTTPVIRGEALTWYVDTHERQLIVGTLAWYAWLKEASTFAFIGDKGTITACKEFSQHGGAYWKAYRKRAGKLHRAYLGKSEDVSLVVARRKGARDRRRRYASATSRGASADTHWP